MKPLKYYQEESIKEKIVSIFKNGKNRLNFFMSIIIFVVAILEITSFFLPEILKDKREYARFYFPLITELELFIFSLFFVLKSFRYESCLDTKIISLLLPFVFLVSILAIMFRFNPENYLIITQPIILFITIILILINALKWFLK